MKAVQVIFLGLTIVINGNAQMVDLPNIILVMCDDLGWGDVGFNGNTIIQTPHLDALADDGVRLSRFYSAAPVCSPTRASCLTGRSPFRMGITTANEGHLPPEEITIAELLKTRGYATGHFGKWHLGTLTRDIMDANRGGRPAFEQHYSIPTEHGYDTYFCTESKVPTWDPMIKPVVFESSRSESLRYGWRAITADTFEEYGTHYWTAPGETAKENLQGDDSRVIMDRVIDFMEKYPGEDTPFFMTLWFHTPHLPVVCGSKYLDLYSTRSPSEQLLYGSITAMDDQVGRLVAYLKAKHIYEKTLIWFCSDNGPERDTPGSSGIYRERKRSLYEGGIRVPGLVVYKDKIPPNKDVDFPLVTHDFLPTIMGLLDMEYPASNRALDGEDFSRELLENKWRSRPAIGFRHRQSKFAWMNQRYKLISNDSLQTFELYDLVSDPSEEKDIYPGQKEIWTQMKLDLFDWITSCALSTRGADYD